MTDSKHIAELNDQFRRQVGIPVFGAKVRGKKVMTAGIAALAPEQVIEVWGRVRDFDHFPPGDDPYGERDFGAFDMEGVGKIFWKIDYYADDKMQWGSEDPSDPAQCIRLLTIMLAEEY